MDKLLLCTLDFCLQPDFSLPASGAPAQSLLRDTSDDERGPADLPSAVALPWCTRRGVGSKEEESRVCTNAEGAVLGSAEAHELEVFLCR